MKHSDRNYRARYGLTAKAVGELVAAQGGKCAICDDHFTPAGKKAACVDHDHATGAIRGILCRECNSAMGKFRDDVDLLLSAATYLTVTA